MNKLKTLSVFAFVLFIGNASAQSQLINANDFEKKLTSTKDKTVLDVRTQSEYNQGHLANAMLIDFYKSDFKKQLSKLDKNKPVFVYCGVGGRSGSASKTLVELGFKQVYDLQGGMQAWTKADKAVVK
jgi:rhodanese-related sulfurtransferase